MREYVTYRNDPHQQLRALALSGATTGNTDAGLLHADIWSASGEFHVDLYKRAGRAPADLVASGSTETTPGPLTLDAANGSGLTGTARSSSRPTPPATPGPHSPSSTATRRTCCRGRPA